MIGEIMQAAASNPITSALNAATNTGIQYYTSKKMARYNYELGQRALRNSPKNYKLGLIEAGINPILASSSPVGATQGSAGINPGMDLVGDMTKGFSALNQTKQTNSNVELQTKQGNAAESQAQSAERQADAAYLNALTNAKKAGVEIKGIESNIGLNEARKATEETLQKLHMSDAHKSEVQALAMEVAQQMDGMQLEYWKDHPEEFNDYMKESLQSVGNINSARNFEKWTNLGKAVIDAADRMMSYSPFGKYKFSRPTKPESPFKKYMNKGIFPSKKDTSINDYDLKVRDLK